MILWLCWWRCCCYEDLLHGRSSKGGDLLPDHGRARERDDAHLVVVGSPISTWTGLGRFRWCWEWWGFLCIGDVNDDNNVLLLLKMIEWWWFLGFNLWVSDNGLTNSAAVTKHHVHHPWFWLSFPNIENPVCKDYKDYSEYVFIACRKSHFHHDLTKHPGGHAEK